MGLATQEQHLLMEGCRNCEIENKCSFVGVQIAFATKHTPVVNHIATGVVGVE